MSVHEPVKRIRGYVRQLSADEEARRIAFVRECTPLCDPGNNFQPSCPMAFLPKFTLERVA